MRTILIGNYTKDKQESMRLYTYMLLEAAKSHTIKTDLWLPILFFGKCVDNTTTGLGKWLGYIDKWLLTMIVFYIRRLFLSGSVRIHICDHSNAPYRMVLPDNRTSITCHDVLAIRGAFGYKDAYCEASAFGIWFQKWILSHLIKYKKIVCVSDFTLNQLVELAHKKQKEWVVIHNPLNVTYNILDASHVINVTRNLISEEKKYMLHVGSNLPRKNKEILIDVLSRLRESIDIYLCLTGPPLSSALKVKIKEYNLDPYVIECIKPSHEILECLYNRADVFIFPSLSEGFGWPVIEAQACGVPVITSALNPMMEVGGEGALYADPLNVDEIVSQINKLQDPDTREQIIQKGLENIQRFDTKIILDKYIHFILS